MTKMPILSTERRAIPSGKIRTWYHCQCPVCGKAVQLLKANYEANKAIACKRCVSRDCVSSEESAWREFYKKYQGAATKKGREFLLTRSEFREIAIKNCHYCDAEPTARKYSAGGATRHNRDLDIDVNGIDRVDSARGYSVDNCVPCCTICNKMKLNYSTSKFLDHIKKILAHQDEK